MAFTWLCRTAFLLAEYVGEGISRKCLLHKAAFAMHAFDAGANGIHGLAEQGQGHGGLVAVKHRKGVEYVEWTVDVQCLKVREQEHGKMRRQFGGVRELWLLWCGENCRKGRNKRHQGRDTHVNRARKDRGCD